MCKVIFAGGLVALMCVVVQGQPQTPAQMLQLQLAPLVTVSWASA
jgi:hypothetical protein